MAGDPDVTDVLTADLERLYTTATRRLAAIVRAGLNRGLDPARLGTPRQRTGDATLAYRQRQHEQALAVLASLRSSTRDLAGRAVAHGYGSGLIAVDRALGENLSAAGRFGRIHIAAVETAAANLEQSLTAAVDAVGDRIGDVFERAQALEGALREDRPVLTGGGRFIGRRHDDPWRRIGLEITAGGTIGLDTRRQRSAMLARRLIGEGLSDGITGLVDASGRRWALDTYAEMVARTTTAEAVTQGTLNRLAEGEQTDTGTALDLVAITSHPHQADVCTPYDGQVFSRTGRTPGYPVLSATPPFHPRCRHRLGPASANLDEFERRLREAVREHDAPPAEAPSTAPPPPSAADIAERPSTRALSDAFDQWQTHYTTLNHMLRRTLQISAFHAHLREVKSVLRTFDRRMRSAVLDRSTKATRGLTWPTPIDWEPGTVIRDEGFQSWTDSDSLAQEFAEGLGESGYRFGNNVILRTTFERGDSVVAMHDEVDFTRTEELRLLKEELDLREFVVDRESEWEVTNVHRPEEGPAVVDVKLRGTRASRARADG